MPDRLEFSLNADEFMQAFAKLKNVPLEKVVRNASRDFVRYARKTTPLAEPVLPEKAGAGADPYKALYYRFRNYRNRKEPGRITYVPVCYFDGKTRTMLRKMQARKVGISRGWLRTIWLAVGVKLKIAGWTAPTGRKPRKTLDLTWANETLAENHAEYELIAKIPAPKFLPRYRPGYWEGIHQGGFDYAAGIMLREMNRILRNGWKSSATIG